MPFFERSLLSRAANSARDADLQTQSVRCPARLRNLGTFRVSLAACLIVRPELREPGGNWLGAALLMHSQLPSLSCAFRSRSCICLSNQAKFFLGDATWTGTNCILSSPKHACPKAFATWSWQKALTALPTSRLPGRSPAFYFVGQCLLGS